MMKSFLITITTIVFSFVGIVLAYEIFLSKEILSISKSEFIEKNCNNKNVSIATNDLNKKWSHCSNVVNIHSDMTLLIVNTRIFKPYYYRVEVNYDTKNKKIVSFKSGRGVEFW